MSYRNYVAKLISHEKELWSRKNKFQSALSSSLSAVFTEELFNKIMDFDYLIGSYFDVGYINLRRNAFFESIIVNYNNLSSPDDYKDESIWNPSLRGDDFFDDYNWIFEFSKWKVITLQDENGIYINLSSTEFDIPFICHIEEFDPDYWIELPLPQANRIAVTGFNDGEIVYLPYVLRWDYSFYSPFIVEDFWNDINLWWRSNMDLGLIAALLAFGKLVKSSLNRDYLRDFIRLFVYLATGNFVDVQVNIIEFPLKVEIQFNADVGDQSLIRAELERILPYNLVYEINFGGV